MPRILEADIQTVRERARIEDVVGAFVSLKSAGGGSLKGLCPFHDEKTPSFNVHPSRGFFHCFGCGEGGDAIAFLQKLNNLSFAEAIEQLADRTGVQLRYEEDGGGRVIRHEPGLRQRVLEMNQLALEFYMNALQTPEARPGRDMLMQRGFGREIAETFNVGWAPNSGRALTTYLKQKGFREDELIGASLTRNGGWDFFQGRVLWPIRDASKSVLGFGARRILDTDRMPAKYINTMETPVYKKSTVLYGLDLARANIGKHKQAVIVEGYTDVMACHVAGIDTAVASCGTAFGEDHARLIERLLGADATGEVIFTFDGDQAGQKAALKAAELDLTFVGQTYVCVAPQGQDPCELRMSAGDAAVRELIATREPLYRFVMRNTVGRYDLDRADSRVDAMRAAAPLVAGVRDQSKQPGFIRELAGMVGLPIEEVAREVKAVRGRKPTVAPTISGPVIAEEPGALQPSFEAFPQPDPRDRRLEVQRDVSKLLIQYPTLFTAGFNGIAERHFSHPGYQAVLRAAFAAGEQKDPVWAQKMLDKADSDAARHLITALAVEPLLREPDERYVDEYCARLVLSRHDYDLRELKSKLQRMNPVTEAERYRELFADVIRGEKERKDLQRRAFGE